MIRNISFACEIIHYDETSPHMHIVGIPTKEKSKYGISKQVGKSDVLTKLSLIKSQDKMRSLCIEKFNKEYGLDNILKAKKPGRNDDINVKDMGNYMIMQEQLERHQENLEKANQSSTKLKDETFDIKELVRDLKNVPLSKTNYILKEKDNEIDDLKEENFSLKSALQSLKNKFTNLLKLFSDKMFSKHDREKYHEVANDLYSHSIITDNQLYEIHDDYKYAKERESKNRNDDFEL